MAKTYKVWVQIESHDDKTDCHENEEPVDVFTGKGRNARRQAVIFANFIEAVAEAYNNREVL